MTDTTLPPGEITDQQPDTWAIVELMGHRKLAGKLSEQTIGGSSFVRIDAPAQDGYRTHLYGNAAIYGIHFVSELVARAVASRIDDAPISAYDLPEHARIAMLEHDDDDLVDAEFDPDDGRVY